MGATSSLPTKFRGVLEFDQAFDRDPVALGYNLDEPDWWLELPLCDLANSWDRLSRLLDPDTIPTLVAASGIFRGGGK